MPAERRTPTIEDATQATGKEATDRVGTKEGSRPPMSQLAVGGRWKEE